MQDEPVRVEVIGRDEIEEKLLMTLGNISTLVAEPGGLRVQVTSPAIGGANIRVRRLEGRNTQLLADGLPLFGQASSIGLLQIAPTWGRSRSSRARRRLCTGLPRWAASST